MCRSVGGARGALRGPARAPAAAASLPRALQALAVCVLAALASLGGSGCCGHPCYGDEDLPLTAGLKTPYDTVDFARFGIRHELWNPLYRAFTARTHGEAFEDEVGEETPAFFDWAFPRITYGDLMEGLGRKAPPEVAAIKLVDVLRDGEIVHIGYRPAVPWFGAPPERQAFAVLRHPLIEDLRWTTILLLDEGTREEPRWAIGLVETAGWLDQQL